MLKKIILIASLLFLFTSCTSEYDKRIKISATTWIGYIPLFYAKEKGWLSEINIKLLSVTSLAENMYIYEAGNSDAYTGTQYEYLSLSTSMPTLKPIIMFDRSNGGDLVMSNISLEELQSTTTEIDAYLEIDSINNTILEDFLVSKGLKNKNINYINKDQVQIKHLKVTSKPTIIVTYVPYNLSLEKNGFMELASTKDNHDIVVVDAMFTKTEFYNLHKAQFIELKQIVDRSIEALHKDPKEFYSVVQPYILEMDYEEFQASLNDIIWINKTFSDKLKTKMIQAKFPIRDLIKDES